MKTNEKMEKKIEERIERRIECGFRRCFHILFHIIFGAGFVALIGWLVMLLWNRLAPDMFGAGAIEYWQAVGLFVLCRLLVGGVGHRHPFHGVMRERIRRKWDKMDPEERMELFRDHGRCCGKNREERSEPESGR